MAKGGRTGRPPHHDQLTPAEWRVIEGVRHGLSNPAIAARLGIGVDAVKFHVGNAIGKLGFTTRKEIRLWNGVRNDSALSTGTTGEAPAIRGVGQIAHRVSDVEGSTRWFAEVLRLEHLYSFPGLAFLRCGEVRIFLSRGDPAANSIIYLRVDDIAAWHQTLKAKGVAIVAAPHMIHRHGDGTEEWMCFFSDRDGSTLALMTTASTTREGT